MLCSYFLFEVYKHFNPVSCICLRLVEGNPHTRRRVMESGNLSSLIHLLQRNKSQRTQEAVARAVWTLAGDEMEAQRMVAGRIGADQMTSQRYNSPMCNFLMPDSAKPALYTIQNHNYYQLHLYGVTCLVISGYRIPLTGNSRSMKSSSNIQKGALTLEGNHSVFPVRSQSEFYLI